MERSKSRIQATTVFVVLLILAAALMFAFSAQDLRPTGGHTGEENSAQLIVDPGHGGIDGGAIALNGMKESDINLAIALKLQAVAQFCGLDPVMTRVDDARRTEFAAYSEHDDLVYRTELINSVKDGVLISIHQNTFPTSQPSGAQVLYAAGDASRIFGELTHKNLLANLQEKNRRVAEPAPPKLYITANARCPAILVECGFLSNEADLDRLIDSSYQTAFASVLLTSFLQYRAMAIQQDYT